MPSTRSNWAGNQRWIVADQARPRSTDEVAAVVRRAATAGRHVKAIGAGHSFTAAAVTDGVQVSLDGMQRVLRVDHATRRVTVEAGIRLHRLNDELAALGLALPNLGDIDRQSIAGAIATATHGTGLGLGNLATTVVGMELVTGTGDVVCVDA
jgi:FAD/FMN-containing dehydrogenase